MVDAETRIHIEQFAEAAQQEARGHGQNYGQGNLGYHKRRTQTMSGGAAAAALLQPSAEVRARCDDRRPGTDERTRHESCGD